MSDFKQKVDIGLLNYVEELVIGKHVRENSASNIV